MDLLEEDLEKKTGVHIVIDYFSATFPFICYQEDSEYQIINEIVLMICDFLNIEKEDISKEDYAMHRFAFQYKLSDHITLRLCGPELKSGHKSCSIELSGQGCREFEEIAETKTWIDFLEFFIVRLNASPTRFSPYLLNEPGLIQVVDAKFANSGSIYSLKAVTKMENWIVIIISTFIVTIIAFIVKVIEIRKESKKSINKT